MIDTSLFGADIPAGTYAIGDIIPLGIIDGPSVVRSGRGAAVLKRITAGILGDVSGSTSYWAIHVKNSDWVDDAISLSATMRDGTSLDDKSGCVQRGHDCQMTPNSTWEVYAECVHGSTTTVANSIYALIDIDYPSVSSIINPETLPGIPATIPIKTTGTPLKALGTLTGSTATTINVDYFKAGYEYALEKMEAVGSAAYQGFISLSDAAGMAGLKRIMPICSTISNIRDRIEYASKLVKGPMNIGFNLFANSGTATTANLTVLFDYVKRRQ